MKAGKAGNGEKLKPAEDHRWGTSDMPHGPAQMRAEIARFQGNNPREAASDRKDSATLQKGPGLRSKPHEMQRALPFVWNAFEKAIRLGGCAICHVLYEEEQRSLFSFLYEGMTSVPVCQEFLDGGGFCRRHFWRATHLGLNFWSVGAFEIANLCQPLVARARAEIQRAPKLRSQSMLGRVLKRPKGTETPAAGQACIFCHETHEREKGLIQVLEKLTDVEQFANAISTKGLCLQHAHMAMSSWKQAAKSRWLLAIMLRHTQEILADLKEFIRKHDHHHRHEPFGREADVVRRTMEFLVGLESLSPQGETEQGTRAKQDTGDPPSARPTSEGGSG